MSKKTLQYSRAVGLEYRSGQARAPVVTVNGDAISSDEIVRVAKRYGVPVIEEPAVARALSALEQEQEIPEELFEAVAVILARLARQKQS